MAGHRSQVRGRSLMAGDMLTPAFTETRALVPALLRSVSLPWDGGKPSLATAPRPSLESTMARRIHYAAFPSDPERISGGASTGRPILFSRSSILRIQAEMPSRTRTS